MNDDMYKTFEDYFKIEDDNNEYHVNDNEYRVYNNNWNSVTMKDIQKTIKSSDEILEELDINDIEQFLRRKKLEKLNKV